MVTLPASLLGNRRVLHLRRHEYISARFGGRSSHAYVTSLRNRMPGVYVMYVACSPLDHNRQELPFQSLPRFEFRYTSANY